MTNQKKLGVMIATPCYGGQLTESYMHGILNAVAEANKKNIQLHLNTMGNESLITRARNTLVSQFLDFDEKEPSKSDVKKDSIATTANKLQKLVFKMKELAKEYSKAEGAKKEKIKDQLKDMTKEKKQLEKAL